MFRKKRQGENGEVWENEHWDTQPSSSWNDLEDDLDLDGSKSRSIPKGLAISLAGGGVILSCLLISLFAYQMWWWTTPAYAAEEWFVAMTELDGETVLDRTCDQEKWLSDTINAGSVFLGLFDYVDITTIEDWQEMVLPGVDVTPILQSLDVDISQVKMDKLAGDEYTAVVKANGPIRFGFLSGHFSYRVDETWLMVQEDDRWKWCGLHQP